MSEEIKKLRIALKDAAKNDNKDEKYLDLNISSREARKILLDYISESRYLQAIQFYRQSKSIMKSIYEDEADDLALIYCNQISDNKPGVLVVIDRELTEDNDLQGKLMDLRLQLQLSNWNGSRNPSMQNLNI